MKKVYCLYRGKDGADIYRQQCECRELAKQQGWNIIKEFCEFSDNISNDTDSLIDLRDGAERKEFEVLLVSQYNNLGRVKEESSVAAFWFEREGIEVMSTQNESKEFIEKGKMLLEIFQDISL